MNMMNSKDEALMRIISLLKDEMGTEFMPKDEEKMMESELPEDAKGVEVSSVKVIPDGEEISSEELSDEEKILKDLEDLLEKKKLGIEE
jgi:hypothetical protein